MKVRVREDHRISELRGTVGKVVGSYGGEEFTVLDVHFPDGRYQLFWPGDLDDVGHLSLGGVAYSAGGVRAS